MKEAKKMQWKGAGNIFHIKQEQSASAFKLKRTSRGAISKTSNGNTREHENKKTNRGALIDIVNKISRQGVGENSFQPNIYSRRSYKRICFEKWSVLKIGVRGALTFGSGGYFRNILLFLVSVKLYFYRK